MPRSSSVIISTYNSPEWLEKTLWGFENQDAKGFQIVLADNGSSEETTDVVESCRRNNILNIDHVWHEGNGSQKGLMLNKSVLRATGDYLIFTEGDCIPRRDFVQAHEKSSRPGYFLAGNFAKLPQCCSEQIFQEQVQSGEAHNLAWLINHGYPDYRDKMRLWAGGLWASLLDAVIVSNKKWNGHNSSGWKSDILSVNGFDERMHNQGEGCEMGERLKNSGVKVRRVDYSATSVGLYPKRRSQSEESKALNQAILSTTMRTKNEYTDFGIIQN